MGTHTFFIVAEEYTLVCMSSQQYNNNGIFHSRKHPYYLHGQIENTPLHLSRHPTEV